MTSPSRSMRSSTRLWLALRWMEVSPPLLALALVLVLVALPRGLRHSLLDQRLLSLAPAMPPVRCLPLLSQSPSCPQHCRLCVPR
jgi:hypothetical protein